MKAPAKKRFVLPDAFRKVRFGAPRLSPTACFTLALLLLSVTTALALRQPLRPDPYKESSALVTSDWWLYPLEWNPPGRLTRIERDLKDVYAVPGTDTVYAVGELGTVIVSTDAGQTWQTTASRTPAPTPSPSTPNAATNSNTPTTNLNANAPAPNRNANTNANRNANSNDAAAQSLFNFLDLTPTAHAAELRAGDALSRSSQIQQQPLPSPTGIPRPTPHPSAMPTATPSPRPPAATPTPRAAQQTPSPTSRPSPQSGNNTNANVNASATASPTPAQIPLASLGAITLSAVHFNNEREGFAVTDKGKCLETADGGISWLECGGMDKAYNELSITLTFEDLSRFAGTGFKSGLGWVARRSTQGEPLAADIIRVKSRDAATSDLKITLETIVDSPSLSPPNNPQRQNALTLTQTTDVFLYGGEGWGIVGGTQLFKSMDGGDTWQPLKSNFPPGGNLRSLVFIDQLRGWAVGDGGEIIATRDGGLMWEQKASGTRQNLKSVSFQPDGQRGWAVGDGGVIVHTEDGGATWVHQSQDGQAAGAARGVYYFRLLPPWYYVSWVAVALLLWPIRRTAVVDDEEEPEASVADVLVSDRPLEEGDADTIGFNSVALGLSRFLRNENTKPPLTIAVTGEWGTGKSSLMNLLRADLRRYDFRPVWFNAWHHQKEEHLLASLLQNVRLQAVPPLWRPEGIIFRLRLLRIRGARQWGPVLLVVLFLAVAVFYELMRQDANTYLAAYFKELASLVYGSGTPAVGDLTRNYLSRLPLLVSLLTFAGTVWRGATAFGVNPASLMASMSRGVRVRDLDAQTSFRQKFAAEFKDVTAALGARSMLIFIDDLDRCRPENVVETLEAVNFLVSSGECFVVIGMARERVEPCVALSFKDVAAEMPDDEVPPAGSDAAQPQADQARQKRLDYARQYLDKLINIEVPVPVPTPEQSCNILMANTSRVEEPDAGPKTGLQVLRARAVAFGLDYWRPLLWAVGLLLLLSGCYALASFLARPVPVEVASPPPTDAARPSNANSNAAANANTNTNGNANTAANTNAAGSAPSATPTPTPSEKERLPALTPGQRSVMLAAVPVLLAASVLLWIGFWVLTRRPGLVVKDSPRFVDALTIWHPLVFARSTTPRSVKRFMNRVRYLAMRQRTQRDSLPFWRRLLTRLRGKPARIAAGQRDVAEGGETSIPDELLVALAAIQHFKWYWLSSDDALLSDPSPPVVAESESEGWRTSFASTRKEWELLWRAKREHAKKFGGWDSAKVAAARKEFLRISQGVQVN